MDKEGARDDLREDNRGPNGLHAQRLEAVATVLRARDVARILDLGCGDCKLLALLASDARVTKLVGVDASARHLALGETRLKEVNRRQTGRVRLLQGSVVYRDQRLQGFDAVTFVEVIEHLDPPRLATMERVVFEFRESRNLSG
jgi:cyclopropane fatty-acyl-phospholipid synthase-like methyltransferase